jgi:hypothetical protein
MEEKMKFKYFYILLILFLALFHNSIIAESWSNIYGKVIDAETKEPIPNAWAIFENVVNEGGGKIKTQTNEKGEFEFKGFPVDDFENELNVLISEPSDLSDFKYYNQRYPIRFKMQKGKNLFLQPIEMKRGVRIEGSIKLWDGSIVEKGRISFDIKNRDEFDSTITWWSALSLITDGHYISMLLPCDVELEMKADLLDDVDKGISYGQVKKIIVLTKGGTTNNIDIIVPNIQTEIKGLVVNKSGKPLKDQVVGIRSIGARVITTESGMFWFKNIEPGEIIIYARYRGDESKTHILNNIIIHERESLFIHIILDENNFIKYSITRNNL